MTSTATRIDYDAARERLSAITTDPALLDGFKRVAQKGNFDDAFLKAALDANISLDHLLFGDGAPFSKGPKRDNSQLAKFLDNYLRLGADDQKTFSIALHLFANEKWAQKMGIKKLFEWLKRKPGAEARHDRDPGQNGRGT